MASWIRSWPLRQPTWCSPLRRACIIAMRIAFDGTTLRPGRTGVGYYTEHLLHHLAVRAGDDQIVVISNRSVDTTRPLPANVRIARSSGRIPRMLWMQTLGPRLLRREQVDVV